MNFSLYLFKNSTLNKKNKKIILVNCDFMQKESWTKILIKLDPLELIKRKNYRGRRSLNYLESVPRIFNFHNKHKPNSLKFI